jgi:hypothetical protein
VGPFVNKGNSVLLAVPVIPHPAKKLIIITKIEDFTSTSDLLIAPYKRLSMFAKIVRNVCGKHYVS